MITINNCRQEGGERHVMCWKDESVDDEAWRYGYVYRLQIIVSIEEIIIIKSTQYNDY